MREVLEYIPRHHSTMKPGCRACSRVPMARISTPISCSCSVRTSMAYGNG